MRKLILCMFAIVLFSCLTETSHAQVCCANPPTSESTTYVGPNTTYPTVSQFEMVLGGGTFSGWTVTEYVGALGADGCWNANVNPSYVPEYPVISGGAWLVGSDNSWGTDNVGWLPGSVTYIRSNSPLYSNTPLIPNFPCGTEVYQALAIQCPQGDNVIYDDVIQTESVYSTYVQNCREGVCSVINQ